MFNVILYSLSIFSRCGIFNASLNFIYFLINIKLRVHWTCHVSWVCWNNAKRMQNNIFLIAIDSNYYSNVRIIILLYNVFNFTTKGFEAHKHIYEDFCWPSTSIINRGWLTICNIRNFEIVLYVTNMPY